MASVYNRQFGPFRGVDFTSNEKDVEDHRMAYAVNLYRNYDAEGGASVETVPGFRRLHAFGEKINGIHRYKNGGVDSVIVHAGTCLYQFDHECRDDGQYSLVTSKIADAKSTSFQFNNKFYLLDGTHLWSYDGTSLTEEPDNAYVPLGYLNGEIYEQRNMLTNKMQERYILPATEEAIRDAYEIEGRGIVLPLHEESSGVEEVSLNGKNVSAEGTPFVSVKNLLREGVNYESVGTYLHDTNGTESGGVEYRTLVTLNVSRKKYTYSFYYTPSVEDVPEGTSGTTKIALFAINVPAGKDYSLNLPGIDAAYFDHDIYNHEDDFKGIRWAVTGTNYEYTSEVTAKDSEPAIAPVTLTLGEGTYRVYLELAWISVNNTPSARNGTVILRADSDVVYRVEDNEIVIDSENDIPTVLLGSTIDISYTADALNFATAKKYTNFHDANPGYSGNSLEAIAKCTLCAVFDGRVFLSGNPDLPNTVFYCQRDNTGHANATYFGVYNYWNEGIEESPIVSLLPTASVLMVFKGDTVQDGSVFYRQGVSLDDDVTPRVYTGSAGVAGIGCVGATCNFFDDPVFLSRRGMEAIGKQTVNLERTMEHRSSNVDAKLMQEDLKSAFMVEWKGYLLILCPNGHVYMADSRATFTHGTGVVQYEWFYLEGIGEYKDAAKAYRYASYLPTDLEDEYKVKSGHEGKLLDKPPKITDGIAHDEFKYLAEWEGEYLPRKLDGEEYADTSFHGARCAMTLDDVLYFGTENGGLFCFNNDYTGEQAYIYTQKNADTAPYYPYSAYKDGVEGWESLGIKPEVYNLSRYFYSFAGQPIHSGMITAMSNAGAPMYTKTTEYRTAVCMMRSIPGSRCRIYWRKDMEAFKDAATVDMSVFDFDDMDFSSLVFGLKPSDSISLRVQERRWLNKQYQVYSDEFLRPFGVHSIAYSFHIHGKVRNK